MAKAWEDLKRTAQSALDDIANSYQEILIRGHLMPSRNMNGWIAEEEYDREHAPEPQAEVFYLNHFDGKEPPEPQPVEPEV